MQLLLDNLTALIISAILILSLQVTQVRSQHAAIEQIASHSMKAKTLVFGEWVEHDILNIGANYGTNLYRFEAPTLDAEGNAPEWMFYSNGVEGGQPIRVIKRFWLEKTTVAEFKTDTLQLYVLHRDSLRVFFDASGKPESYTASDWTPIGESISTLSFFRVDLIDRTGETPTYPAGGPKAGEINIDKIDYIRVRFGVVPEFVIKPDNYIRELYWAKTLKVRPYWVPPKVVSS